SITESTAIASSIAAFSTLAQASKNLSYDKPASGPIVSHSEVRVAWGTTKPAFHLMLSLVKHESDTNHWPLGHRPMRIVWIKPRMNAGNASFAFWDIPEVDGKEWYACEMQGREARDDGKIVTLERTLTEWFPIHKAGKYRKGGQRAQEELKV
ncbi:unnamed protein product, partial [Aureobasidium pullulans]